MDRAFATHGLPGVLMRIQDKLQRYMGITKGSVKLVEDETLRDTLKVRRVSPDATLPTRGSVGAVGYDLYSAVDTHVGPGERVIVNTGISISLPPGVYARVAPRSGLSVKHGIQTGAGVVDPDYTGEVKVILFNHGNAMFDIKQGDRIAQLILEKCDTPPVEEVYSLDDTERGASGFGSTGT